jgi:DnaA family protein
MTSPPPEAGPGRPASPQLPLALAAPVPSLAAFEAGANAAALAAVARLAHTRRGCVALWGPAGSGKSHLLAAAVHEAGKGRAGPADDRAEAGATADAAAVLQLAGRAIASLPERIHGHRLEAFDLIALDTAAGDWGDAALEEAVFRACHRARAGELGLLVALPAHPAEAGITLADLRSRLLGGDCFRLAPVDEPARRRILAARAEARGLCLSDEALDYLLARLPRDLHSLCGFVDRLDQVSLAEQRRPTVPLLRSLIEGGGPLQAGADPAE